MDYKFSKFEKWIKYCRQFLRYPYDRSGVPQFSIGALSDSMIVSISGPADPNKSDPTELTGKQENYYGISSTTYPSTEGGWSLICDRYCAEIYKNWAVICLADGCNWGPRPKTAAWKASNAFVDFVRSQKNQFTGTREVGYLLFKAFAKAHKAICEGVTQQELWDVGTTTLIGGVLLPLVQSEDDEHQRYIFICSSVGDCKAMVYNHITNKASEITLGNRGGIDATDPGGRLGPYVGAGDPDLRNLHLYFIECQEGETLMLMSDGVHDNLDAYALGKSPTELGLNVDDWKKAPERESSVIKSKFMCDMANELLKTTKNPAEVAHILIKHSISVTEASRDFMINNPTKKLPVDYVNYPGKMDHSTCVCIRVGGIE